MSKLTIVRGLPGSGKSTFAQSMGIYHVEADMFHMKDGEYKWIGHRVKAAHTWCQSAVRLGLSHNLDVVVSNTSTTLKELQPYLDMSWDTLVVFKMVGDYGNTHDVPPEVIKKMATRWQDYPGEITIYKES